MNSGATSLAGSVSDQASIGGGSVGSLEGAPIEDQDVEPAVVWESPRDSLASTVNTIIPTFAIPDSGHGPSRAGMHPPVEGGDEAH